MFTIVIGFDHIWAFHMLGILKHPTLDLQTHATVRRSCLAFCCPLNGFCLHANIHLAFAALCFPRLFLSWNPNPIQNVLKSESQTVRVLFLTLHHWVQLRLLWPQISGQTLRWNWWNRGWNRGVCRQGPSEPCPASSEVGKKRKQDSVLRWKLHHTVPPAHFHSPVSCLDDHPSNGYNPLLHGKISSLYRSFYCPQLRQEATTRTLGWHENQKWHFKIGMVILVVAGPIGVLPGCRCSLHRHCDDPPVMPTFLWDHMTGFIWRIFFQIVSFSCLGIANHDSKIWTNTQNRSHRIEYIYIYI